MTTIKISHKDHHIDTIAITGHANFKDAGKDIVCASISTLTFYTINALHYFKKADYVTSDVNVKKDQITFTSVKFDKVSQKLLELLISHLKGLASQYKDNITIKEK